MGLRSGFFLGFLTGAATATLISKADTAEAPGESGEAASGTRDEAHTTVDRAQRFAREALQVARDAAQEKEAELRRNFEESIRRRRSDS